MKLFVGNYCGSFSFTVLCYLAVLKITRRQCIEFSCGGNRVILVFLNLRPILFYFIFTYFESLNNQ